MCDLLLSRYGAAVNELPLVFGLELAAHGARQEQRAAAALSAQGRQMPVDLPPRPFSNTPREDILNHALDIRRRLAKKQTPSAGE